MKISPPALIVTVGTLMILGAFVFGGKAKTAEDVVPVPVSPKGAPSGTIGYRYRGLFIAVVPAGSVPIPGFASAYQWNVYASNDFSVAPIATSEADDEASSLSEAMAWIDTFRSTPPLPQAQSGTGATRVEGSTMSQQLLRNR